MRRPRNKQLSTIYLKRRQSVKDNEGVVTASFGSPHEFKADIASNTNTVQAMMYGEKSQYMRNITVWDSITLSEGDGICIASEPNDDPDYVIVAIHYYTYFRTVEIEKRIVS